MDSMRSLNTSLPTSPRTRRSKPPPEQLIQSFKSAALSVTNLYKTAAADQARARLSGYQDALDDILAFLDKENIGLDDGEGWRIRQWATERLDGNPHTHNSSDSDDDRGETAGRVRSISPPRTIPAEVAEPRQVSRSASPIRTVPAATPQPSAPLPLIDAAHEREVFSFRSTHPYPQDFDMQGPTASNPDTTHNSQTHYPPSNPALRFDVQPRAARTPNRTVRHSNRPTGNTRSLGLGGGSKRSFRAGDYFDLASLGDGKDSSSGGGKRARFT